MSVRLFLLERWLPRPARRRVFSTLVSMTARAFGTSPPDLGRLGMEDAVEAFARFTRLEAERVRRDTPADAERVRDRLFDGSRKLGYAVRRAAGIRTREESLRALRLLYEAIGIDLEGSPVSNELTIRRCTFAAAYTPEVCGFISALDAGLVSGLTGGATLHFTRRITEGAPCCSARLSWGSPR